MDADYRTFFYRSSQADWLEAQGGELYNSMHELLKDVITCERTKKANEGNERGPHFPCIIGHYRQYSKVGVFPPSTQVESQTIEQAPTLTQWHRKRAAAVDKFISTPVMRRIT